MERTILTYIANVPTLKEQILDIMTELEKEAQKDVEILNRDYVNSDEFKSD